MTVTAEIAALSPTAHWRFSEASGTVAEEENNVHDGAYVNTPTLGATGYATDGTAVTFDRAQNEGVSVTDHADLDWGTSDVSVFLAVKMPSWYTSNWQGFFTKGSGDPYLIGTQPTTNRCGIFIVDTTFNLDITTNIADDAWHALLFTLDRSALASLYVDGATTPEATVNISAKVATDLQSSAPVYIGRGEGAYPLSGSLQHVAYWKGVLITGSQFATIHAARSDTSQLVLPDADILTTGWSSTPLWSKLADEDDGTVITATAS